MACKNSLVGNKIDERLIPEFITVIPAGVTELVKKQAAGYGYIKP
jgi:intracellular sulfur oxidation DsrE/DsrF family protein